MEFELRLSVPPFSLNPLFCLFYFSLFSQRLPPLPHFCLTPFCAAAATHILWTGLYIVFEIIFGVFMSVFALEWVCWTFACIFVHLNVSDGCFCLYVCVWVCAFLDLCEIERARQHRLVLRMCTSEGMFYIYAFVCLRVSVCVCVCACVCVLSRIIQQ